ncbi:hypothetical protein [Haloarchaeobius baliensis]|uniref:hypothetical protein n=1 Tax=Haloarchaeobius baliensis TaxID=1670458 RepID=UPI003F881F0E
MSSVGISHEELRVRERSRPKPTTSREFRCDDCRARCTRMTDGTEAGHAKGCPHRLRRLGKGQRAPPSTEIVTDGGASDDA